MVQARKPSISFARLPVACAAYTLYVAQALRHGPANGRALRYRLLAHYLVGSGRDVDLGYLPVDLEPYCWSVHAVQAEIEWTEQGFISVITPGIEDDDYHPCFGAFYARAGEGPWMECRDLYDWHPTVPGARRPIAQIINLVGVWSFLLRLSCWPWPRLVRKLAIMASRSLSAFIRWANVELYRVSGVMAWEESVGSWAGGDVWELRVPDAIWLRIGGKPFVTRFFAPIPRDGDGEVSG